MALNNVVASMILFYILSTFIGEAHIASSPGDSPTDSPAASPTDSPGGSPTSSSECPLEEIKFHLIGTSEKTKEFLKEDIIKRMDDNTLDDGDRECLFRCFNAYQGALGSIESAINDVSVNSYAEAYKHLFAFSVSIDASLKCKSDVIKTNPEFLGMQKWAEFSAEDILNKLVSCGA